MVQKIRRIVTGHDKDGRSVIVSDGFAHNVYSPSGAPNVGLTDLWVTDDAPASNAGNDDATKRPLELRPRKRGTTFRVVEIPPDKERNFGVMQQYFAGMGAGDGVRVEGARHPGFHKTDSVDYIVILSGEIWALMDEGEALMKAGDCLVQRGTSHAWSNRSDKPCLLAAILVDAHPAP